MGPGVADGTCGPRTRKEPRERACSAPGQASEWIKTNRTARLHRKPEGMNMNPGKEASQSQQHGGRGTIHDRRSTIATRAQVRWMRTRSSRQFSSDPRYGGMAFVASRRARICLRSFGLRGEVEPVRRPRSERASERASAGPCCRSHTTVQQHAVRDCEQQVCCDVGFRPEQIGRAHV